jgi:hypothetical protein
MTRACLLAALLACAADSLGTAVVAGDFTAHSASRGDGVACQWDPSNGSTVVAPGGVAPLTCSVSAGRGTLAVNAGADEWSGVGKLQLVDTVAMAYRADEVLPKGRMKVKHSFFVVNVVDRFCMHGAAAHADVACAVVCDTRPCGDNMLTWRVLLSAIRGPAGTTY